MHTTDQTVVRPSKRRLGGFLVCGLLVAISLAFLVSPYASSKPDGLNKVAIDENFSSAESEHVSADGPLAGYEVRGVDDDSLAGGLSGIIGVAVAFTVGAGGFYLLSRRASGRATTTPAS